MLRRASDQESNSTLRYISGSRAFATLYENGVIPMNVLFSLNILNMFFFLARFAIREMSKQRVFIYHHSIAGERMTYAYPIMMIL